MGFIMDGLESEAYDRTYTDRQLLARIGGYFKPVRARLAGVAVVLALASLSEFAAQVVVARSLDAAAARPSVPVFVLLAAIVIALGGIGWLFNYSRHFLSGRAVGDTIYALRSEAFEKAVAHDLSFYDENSSGRVVSRVTTDTEDFANVIALVADFLSQILLVAIFFAYLSRVSAKLSLLLLCMAPLAAVVALAFRRAARFVTLNAKRVTAEVNARIQESIAGISTAKAFRRELALWNAFKDDNRTAYRFGLRRGIVLQLIFPVVALASGLGNGFVAYSGGLATRAGAVTLGEWFLFMQAVGYFWWPMLNIASFWSQLQDGLAAAERVFSLIDREPKVKQVPGAEFIPLPGKGAVSVEYRGVGFSYSSKETVLRDFSLSIRPGEKLAIVGRTGAGKSSVVKLLCRFYEFQEGELLVDGRDIRSIGLADLRSRIGLVSQDPFLFPGTVADNVRYARPGAADAEVERAARSLGRGDWVDDLPDGLATETGHRGSSISMGQRQLVALARILVKDPALFILDETTSSVDPFTEAQIQEGLETVMRDRTAIVIAHRLSTVRFADRIVVLDRSGIVEEGSHDALLASGGEYSKLYEMYFRHQSFEYIEKATR
ncbi:MAG: ABC transporter ATP-binding protein [Spirochaetes bacterium]|nr:ABC transporter ATP-binding protein [Spirochaetota bacterium]